MDWKEILGIVNIVWPYIVMFGGFVWGLIQRKYGLPKIVIQAIKMLENAGISVESIEEIINTAGHLSNMTDVERRAWAVAELQKIASRNGISLSDSTGNLIVEWIYNRLKIKKAGGSGGSDLQLVHGATGTAIK